MPASTLHFGFYGLLNFVNGGEAPRLSLGVDDLTVGTDLKAATARWLQSNLFKLSLEST